MIFTHGGEDDRQWKLANLLAFMVVAGVVPFCLQRCGSGSGASTDKGERGCDLRKTARGASSPAKPALHIPELHSC